MTRPPHEAEAERAAIVAWAMCRSGLLMRNASWRFWEWPRRFWVSAGLITFAECVARGDHHNY